MYICIYIHIYTYIYMSRVNRIPAFLIWWSMCSTLSLINRKWRKGSNWHLHDNAIIHIVWCMTYTRGVGGGVVYCVIDVHQHCNSAG